MSRYFSNGTEGHAWMAEWCNRCANDHACHTIDGDAGDGCEIVLRSMVNTDDVIPEWVDECEDAWHYLPRRMNCLMFSLCKACHPDDDGPERPRRPKPGPGQEQLFDVPEHHLMWKGAAEDYLAQFPAEVDA